MLKSFKFRRDIKRLRFLFFPPILVTYVLLPVLAWQKITSLAAASPTSGLPTGNIYMDFQVYSSIFCIWWIFFILQEYLDGEGNELLFTMRQSRFLVLPTLFFLILHLVMLSGYAVILEFWIGGALYPYVVNCVQCLFFTGLFFMLTFLVRNAGFAVLGTISFLLYTAYFVFSAIGEGEDKLFVSVSNFLDFAYFHHFYIYIILGIIFLTIGSVLNYHYRGNLN